MDGGSLRYYYVLPCGHFLEFSNETLDEFLLTQFTPQTFFFFFLAKIVGVSSIHNFILNAPSITQWRNFLLISLIVKFSSVCARLILHS